MSKEEAVKNNPFLSQVKWNDVLRADPELFNSIIAGILRIGEKRKAAINYNVGTKKLHSLQDIDYTELPFHEAFSIMSNGESTGTAATKIGCARSTVYNLRTGISKPSFELMEKIAEGYGREPSYFLEYRIGIILFSMESFLEKNSETATVWYNKVSNKNGIAIS